MPYAILPTIRLRSCPKSILTTFFHPTSPHLGSNSTHGKLKCFILPVMASPSNNTSTLRLKQHAWKTMVFYSTIHGITIQQHEYITAFAFCVCTPYIKVVPKPVTHFLHVTASRPLMIVLVVTFSAKTSPCIGVSIVAIRSFRCQSGGVWSLRHTFHTGDTRWQGVQVPTLYMIRLNVPFSVKAKYL
jgi:hypothetical protein